MCALEITGDLSTVTYLTSAVIGILIGSMAAYTIMKFLKP